MLALFGRVAFWPVRPKIEPTRETGGWWTLARWVTAHHRAVWVTAGLALVVCAAFLPQFKASGIAQSDFFLTKVDSVTGQRILGEHFPGGTGSPVVIVADAARTDAVTSAVRAVPGVVPDDVRAAAGPSGAPTVVDGRVLIEATLADAADSEAAVDTVRTIRTAVHDVPEANALVGGTTATPLGQHRTPRPATATRSSRSFSVVIFVILVLLLRAIVAPLLLIATVVLSYAATLGIAALVFNHIFDFPVRHPDVPLFGFVFLVALGVDYNIFLMTRVREETLRHGPTVGVQRGLAVTGGVITSAGVVLAATFGALAVIPLLFLAQVAFIVAFGVLLDTLVVRSLLVPGLAVDLGRRLWWPSRLGRAGSHTHAPSTPTGRDGW